MLQRGRKLHFFQSMTVCPKLRVLWYAMEFKRATFGRNQVRVINKLLIFRVRIFLPNFHYFEVLRI